MIKPFVALAPMEGVTDSVFRRMVGKAGKPDVFYTEFTSVDGICSEGLKKVTDRLLFSTNERPIVAQIWGKNPDNFCRAARIISEMGFDGIDINLGCPVREVMRQGACGAMIGKNDLVKEIVEATKKGAGGLPVSVKTRIGNKKIMTEEWIGFLLSLNLAEITVHGRTVAEQSKVAAHWDEIAKAVVLRNQMKVETSICGNGDVKTGVQAGELSEKYGVDGIMIGRGIFESPAALSKDKSEMGFAEKIELMNEHARMWEEVWQGRRPFVEFRKLIKMYVNGFDGAAGVRAKLMEAANANQVEEVCRNLLGSGLLVPAKQISD